ncbi:MAG: glycerol kinase GlpK [Dehalococcoidia bacterium]|nr:glycerol kinase GlpK [Dehalococcoidia bacterium]
MPDYILAIDQGTTSSRALVVDRDGAVRGVGQEQFPQYFPRPGWVEHDPGEIWASTEQAIGAALAAAGVAARDLAAVGITNQRETVIAWERATGRPVAPAIVWQDRRTAGECEALRGAGHEARVAHLTGLTLDPYFSGTKVRWLLQSVPGLRSRAESGEIAVGTVDSWLVWKLTGGARHVTDYTNASRTLLFNILRGRWDDELLTLFDVPRAVLPAVLPSGGRFGVTAPDVLGAPVPILAVAGDQQSALFGQACLWPGQAKNTYGTGCFLLANAGRRPVTSANRLLVSMGAGAGTAGPEYVLEGSVFVAGALIQWLCDGLRLFENQAEVEALAATVPDAHGVTIVPALTGLGAPHWDPEARGAILGLTRGTSRAHIARAALEAIALSSAELALAMNRDLPQPISELRVDGGASRNDLLMQMQADALGVPVIRPRNVETTAMGAAYLAGISAGIWANADEVAEHWQTDRVFEPNLSEGDRLEIMANWRESVGRVLTRGEG